MSEKVKVSREVANFIEEFEKNVASHNGWEDDLIAQHSESWVRGFEGVKEDALCMKNISPIELAEILINGYEIEQTPEEKLLENFNWIKDEYKKAFDNGEDFYISKYQGMYDGVKSTLETLGIKIEGINK